ncbi:MAG: NUDIX hydrolase [Acidimicrobiales bacterium]
MTKPRRTRVAAYAVCIEDERVLLARVSDGLTTAGLWVLPGGGIDWGEPPEDAAVREVHEETGLDVSITGSVGVYSMIWDRSLERPYGPVHALSIIYTAEVVGGTLTNEVDGSTDLAAWQPLSGLDELPMLEAAAFGLGLALDRPIKP